MIDSDFFILCVQGGAKLCMLDLKYGRCTDDVVVKPCAIFGWNHVMKIVLFVEEYQAERTTTRHLYTKMFGLVFIRISWNCFWICF